MNRRQCIILVSTELSTGEDAIRAGIATDVQAQTVVTRVTLQHNVKKYVPSNVNVKIKQSRYMPVGAQRVPRSLGSQISWRHRMVLKLSALRTAAFTPRKCSWYAFLLEAELTPGSLCDRKDFMSMKNSSDTSWDRSSDLPICSTAT